MSPRLRPSPALIVASLALVVALGGTAYAVTSINGRTLVDHSVAGRKLMNNTITGAQVNESALGRVPKAGDASTVDGLTMRKVFYAPSVATGRATRILSLGGLIVKGLCSPAINGAGDVQILATTAFTHAHLSAVMWNSGGGGQADGLRVPDFSGETETLNDDNGWGEVSFTYVRPGGTIVHGSLGFDSSNQIGGKIFNNTRKCLISGIVTSTASK